MGSNTLHMLVPGLLGPMPGWKDLQPAPRYPLLERLLSRADPVPAAGEDYESTLSHLFNLERAAGIDLPTAALRRIADGGEPDDRLWIQVTPVHLRPDQDRLLLFDVEEFDFSLAEAEALASLFNEHFAEIGWQLEAPVAHRWYLTTETAPGIITSEVSAVFGRNMDMFLPRGVDALQWHSLLNEVQMLFNTAQVNEQRSDQGKLPVNGTWLSGIGRLPQLLDPGFLQVYSNDPLASGLALAAGIRPAPLEEGYPAGLTTAQGDELVVYDRLQRSVMRSDPFDWSDALAEFEQGLSQLLEMIRRGEVQRLLLYPCNGNAYEVRKRTMGRFWRRPAPLGSQLQL
ncbi:MAG: hypothetical protein ABW146_05785 [Candidatus Sedimenticola sp. 6PFRAG7]